MDCITCSFLRTYSKDQSPTAALKQLRKQTPQQNNIWKNIAGLNDTSGDYIVILGNNDVDSNVYLNEQKPVIYIRTEPDKIQKYVDRYPSVWHQNYRDLNRYNACLWLLTLCYDQLNNLKYTKKFKNTSLICSDKYTDRNTQIINAVEMYDIDYIGNIFTISNTNNRVSFRQRDRVFLDYNKSICIENSSQENYFTEKITDCMLGWCLPLYWGCPNIQDFFPEGSYRSIDISCVESLKEAIEKPVSLNEIKALAEARQLILNKYNIWSTVHSIINRIK